jgi:hypothetical protein
VAQGFAAKLEIMGRTLPSRCDEKMGGTITF